jgi:hypothetical protein
MITESETAKNTLIQPENLWWRPRDCIADERGVACSARTPQNPSRELHGKAICFLSGEVKWHKLFYIMDLMVFPVDTSNALFGPQVGWHDRR